MAEYDFGAGRIKELERIIANKDKVFEDLVTVIFSSCELRDLWRKKFGLPCKCEGEEIPEKGVFE